MWDLRISNFGKANKLTGTIQDGEGEVIIGKLKHLPVSAYRLACRAYGGCYYVGRTFRFGFYWNQK